jgi:hypothetical protein
LENHTRGGAEGEVAMLADASDERMLFERVRVHQRARLDSFRFPRVRPTPRKIDTTELKPHPCHHFRHRSLPGFLDRSRAIIRFPLNLRDAYHGSWCIYWMYTRTRHEDLVMSFSRSCLPALALGTLVRRISQPNLLPTGNLSASNF